MTVQQLLESDSTLAYLVLDRFLIVTMMLVAACGWMVAFGLFLLWLTRERAPQELPRIPLARPLEYQTVLFTNLGPLGWKPEEVTVRVPLRYEPNGVNPGEGTLLETAGGMTWIDATPTPQRGKVLVTKTDVAVTDVDDTVVDNRPPLRPVTIPIPRLGWYGKRS